LPWEYKWKNSKKVIIKDMTNNKKLIKNNVRFGYSL
jgi:hypothetical protein